MIGDSLLENFNIKQFRYDLIFWFEQNQRDLPWRENKDPYRIWVSEVMLQQTRVDTVIPYFYNFVEKFPTIEALASAEEQDILKAWEGLGYYSRVRNLQSAVKEVVSSYGGTVPDTKKEIASLKGVGPYTAGAILSIAYGKPEPAVDGNVMRVLARILFIEDDIAKPKTRKIFEKIIAELISEENPSAFNQGIMELGALVCTPKSPSCLLCPVQSHCQAYQRGAAEQLPVKSKKKKPQIKHMAAIILENEHHQFLIHQRPNDGLLARLWEFPNHETDNLEHQQAELSQYVADTFHMNVHVGECVQQVEHVFSHLVWKISVYQGELLNELEETETLRWVNERESEAFPFPVSHQKIIKENIIDG